MQLSRMPGCRRPQVADSRRRNCNVGILVLWYRIPFGQDRPPDVIDEDTDIVGTVLCLLDAFSNTARAPVFDAGDEFGMFATR